MYADALGKDWGGIIGKCKYCCIFERGILQRISFVIWIATILPISHVNFIHVLRSYCRISRKMYQFDQVLQTGSFMGRCPCVA